MKIDLKETNQGDRGVNSAEVEFSLATLEDSRKTFSGIIEAYAAGGISENKARCLGYLFSNFLPFWKLEKDIDIEKDLEEIKAILRERGVMQ